MRSFFPAVFWTAFVVVSCSSSAQDIVVDITPAFPNLFFSQPTDIQNAGDGSDRLFVCEKEGVIRVFRNDPATTVAETFLDISDQVIHPSEMGLLGMAFHPDYAENGYFYVNYNRSQNDTNWTIISRFSVDASDPDAADVESEVVLMRIRQPFTNHNGGQLAFGPDGYLYIGTGDGGSGGDPFGAGQRLNTLLGKILRIDVDRQEGSLNYGIPEDNPFMDIPEAQPEIFAYGIRNPWRFSFDPATGWLWLADVGQDQYEEIDIVEIGKNYGWNTMEGWSCYNPSTNCDSTGLTGPVWVYPRAEGRSITGGYVYRGSDAPELTGRYVYADFVSGRVWALRYEPEGETANTLLIDTDAAISTFGVDEAEELYFGTFGGSIYKFTSVAGVNDRPDGGLSDVAIEGVTPNPAGETVTVRFSVARRSDVLLAIYNARGEEVERLVDSAIEPGEHEISLNTGKLTESAYFVRLESARSTVSTQFTVVR